MDVSLWRGLAAIGDIERDGEEAFVSADRIQYPLWVAPSGDYIMSGCQGGPSELDSHTDRPPLCGPV